VKQGLSLGFSQGLSLTPQLQQSIRLLQLSTLELEQEIEHQLATNPFLERESDITEREQFDSVNSEGNFERHSDEMSERLSEQAGATADTVETLDSLTQEPSDWGGDGSIDLAPNDTEWGVDATSANRIAGDGESDPLGGLSRSSSLQEHLKQQAKHLRLSPADAASLDFLIDSLNEQGFLTESLPELAACLTDKPSEQESLQEQLQIARQWLQQLEPCGVGAQDVCECLRLQLQERQATLPPDVYQAAIALLHLPLELLARQQVQRLAQLCGLTVTLIQLALGAIKACEPLPARRFMALNNSIIVPDVIVRQLPKAKFDVQLNLDLIPRLKVDEVTARLFKLHKQRERAKAGEKDPQAAATAEAMQQSLLEARGFIKAITQRFDTVLRVAIAIVARQGLFFQHGAVAMRPLVLRDIADELGMHESTISRVTTNKFMHTPQGTFEFKHFFDASLDTDSGGETSGTAVRALIAQLIAAENKHRPLSDGKLASLLESQGIECARRTVAKYREAMRIPVARLRRLGQ
jgi:RNA polymerase sigma-54 factor